MLQGQEALLLRLKCTKFDFDWSSALDPAGGAYSAPPDPLAVFKGAYFQGGGGERGRGRGGELEGPPFRVGIGPRNVNPALNVSIQFLSSKSKSLM